MIKAHGILFVEDLDKHDEIVSVQGAELKLEHAPVKSINGNLLGKVLSYAAVYRAITEESITLAMKSGLKAEVSEIKSENAVSGSSYLELEKPFVKINVSLLENTHLREAIREGNLFFGLSGKVIERQGKLISKCVIDSVLVSMSPVQPYTKIYLD